MLKTLKIKLLVTSRGSLLQDIHGLNSHSLSSLSALVTPPPGLRSEIPLKASLRAQSQNKKADLT